MSTYVAIQAITLTSSATEVTFGAIPQSYSDLVVVCSVTGNRAANVDSLAVRFNGDTSSAYSYTYIAGEVNTGAISGRASSQTNVWCGNFTSNNVANPTPVIIQVQNYASTSANKVVLARGNPIAGGGYTAVNLNVGTWRSTDAIINMTVRSETGNSFLSGSTFTLYGVGEGSPKAFGGSTVVSDGTYWYHAFQSSGIFEPVAPLTADILVVAGGGGGNLSSASAGGAGAGGLLTFTSQSLAATSYPIIVGAGGAGTVSANAYSAFFNGTNGNSSRFGSLTNVVGGGIGGGYSVSTNGSNGGSGGGGATNSGTGGSPTSGQGNAGGAAGNGGNFFSGGGGGAGGAGGSGVSGLASGGIGATSALITAMGNATSTGQLSGGNRYYAGGGGGSSNGVGGGSGGLGGGGAGASVNKAGGNNGSTNTGGGAGGGSNTEGVTVTGGNGGSGIVIVRYPV